MKEKTKKNIRGSITILMIIIMLPMMTMGAIIVDSSRINMARSMVSSAGDLAANSMLANYDTIVKDVYGLFAMSQNKSADELAADIKGYFKKTLVSYGVVNEAESDQYVDKLMGDFKHLITNTESGEASNFLDMQFDENAVQIMKVPNSSLAEANIMRSQIVEYMKYRAPVNFGLSFLDSIKSFKSVQKQTEVVETQVKAQESAQDVTDDCNETIKSIRKHDKIVKYLDEGEGTAPIEGIGYIKGKASNGDGVGVGILQYPDQVDKYRSSWGVGGNESYEYINKINLIFLAKSPKIDSLWLSKLKVDSSQFYVKWDKSGILYSNSGVDAGSISTSGTTDELKTRLDNQLAVLNNKNGTEWRTKQNFPDFLSQSNLGATKTKFANEEAAISTFIEFEKFVNNDSSATVKYSDVQTALKSLYIAGNYYDKWKSLITTDINNARTEMNNANTALSNASNAANNNKTNITNNVTYINNANKNYDVTTIEFLEDFGTFKSEVESILAQQNVIPPTGTVTEGGKSFVQYGNFIKTYYNPSNDSQNMYIKMFNALINDEDLSADPTYEKVCQSATKYLSDKANGKTTRGFAGYMVNVKGVSSSNELYKLLKHLYTCDGYVNKIANNINAYNDKKNNHQQLKNDAVEKTDKYNDLVTDKADGVQDFENCMSAYMEFGKSYQNSLKNYDLYIQRAKDIVTNRVGLVKTQFTNIKNNVNAIIKQLEAIETNLTNAKSSIETYRTKLGEWNTANNSYASQNGADSFSKQNTDDYKASLNQYDITSLETLKDYVGVIKGEYQAFYNTLTDTVHFKYGSKKIDTISNSSDAVSAISGIKNSLPAIVTKNDATSKFAGLYNSDTTAQIVLENGLYFLDPVLPLQFLKYLVATYPEPDPDAPATSDVTLSDGQSISVGEDSGDFNYNKTKDDLKNNDEQDPTEATDTNKYGYTYDGKHAKGGEGKDMPSQIAEVANGTDKKAKQFDIDADSENGDQIDASSGLSEQSGVLGSLLGGIGNVLEDAVETTYVLNYIFENFSYNTIVQDEVMERNSEKIESENAWNLLTESNRLLGSESETLKAVKDDPAKTLSNYKINGKNNYLYGAEIEYILFGNRDSVKNNVTSMKASIYAIRFAFDCIFAFTDSEIKASTMSVGLAVQAATLGIVPYKLVQVVLQLALAAAEAAMDLKLISNGVDVVVVKTKDTWSLSISSAVKAAGELVVDEAVNAAGKAISAASSGLQGLVDAGADEINGAIKNLSSDLRTGTEAKLNEVLDGAVNLIQSKVEEKLNEMQFFEYTENTKSGTPLAILNNRFDGLSADIKSELRSKFGGNEIGNAILPSIEGEIDEVVNSVKGKVETIITNVGNVPKKVGDAIAEEMTEIKMQLMKKLTGLMDNVEGAIADKVDELTGEVADQLKGYIEQTEEKLTEEATTAIKEKVTNLTNDFTNKYLDDAGSNVIGSGSAGSTSSSVASMFKFGYKEYLMLFVFIGLFVPSSETAMLTRVADVIQLNITNAGEGAEFKHQKGADFRMSNAYTYVSVKANAKLDMLFLNMNFFQRVVSDDETQVEGDLTPNAEIKYNGLLGY